MRRILSARFNVGLWEDTVLVETSDSSNAMIQFDKEETCIYPGIFSRENIYPAVGDGLNSKPPRIRIFGWPSTPFVVYGRVECLRNFVFR